MKRQRPVHSDSDDFDLPARTPAEEEVYAVVERTHALADLFSSLPKGDRKRRLVEVQAGEAVWRFAEFWSLGEDDQTVFLALLAMVGKNNSVRITPQKGGLLRLGGQAAGMDTLAIHTSAGAIIRECGWEESGKRRKLLYASLRRLEHTSFAIEYRGVAGSGGVLVASYREADGRISVAISPLLARVFLARGVWARISLTERRMLGSAVARLAHARLSAWLRPGEGRQIGIDTLAGHIWDDDDGVADGTVRKRRNELRCALGEIGKLAGWRVKEEGGMVFVCREKPQRALQRRKNY